MKSARPVNLEITTMKLPIMGIASILHRISAVVIWVGLACALPVLAKSLSSPMGFMSVQDMMANNFLAQFLAWGFMTAMGYYVAATLKHIIQDFGHFETLEGGRTISIVSIAFGIVMSVFFAVLVWG